MFFFSQPLQRVKKLKFNIFSGDMRVGKNPFCFAELTPAGVMQASNRP